MRLSDKHFKDIKNNHKLILVEMGKKIYGWNSIDNSNVLYKQKVYKYWTNNSKTLFLDGWAYISVIDFKKNGLDDDIETRIFDSVESANKCIEYLGRVY